MYPLAKTKVGVDRLDVKHDDFSVLAGDDEGESDVGTEGVPEDVCEKCEEGSGDVKDEKENERNNHTNCPSTYSSSFLGA